MHNRDSFWKPFGSERVNESQKILKSSEKHFYPTFSFFWAKLSLKKLNLIRSEILGLLVNMLTAHYDHSRSNREYLPLQIHTKFPKKPRYFWSILFQFLKSSLNLQCSETKICFIGQIFRKLLTPKYVLI